MTRNELLKIVIGRARTNGFEFRRWYTARIGLPWITAEAAILLLEQQRRYYALLFSHEFAITFWKPGEEISFQVPSQTFQRIKADGSIATIARKAFTRRSARPDSWRYHLSNMALAEEPLRYIRKYLNVEDELTEENQSELAAAISENPPPKKARKQPAAEKKSRSKPIVKPLPKDTPAFLLRPYPPRDQSH